jgi:hypothetical protein
MDKEIEMSKPVDQKLTWEVAAALLTAAAASVAVAFGFKHRKEAAKKLSSWIKKKK